MPRLRAILLLRSGLAVVMIGVGIGVLAAGSLFFGLFALAFGVTNAVMVVVLARRSGLAPGRGFR